MSYSCKWKSLQQEKALVFPNRMSGGRPFETFQIDPAFSKYQISYLYLGTNANMLQHNTDRCSSLLYRCKWLSSVNHIQSQLPTLSDAAVAQLLLEWCQPWKGRTYSILDKDHQPYPQLIQWGYLNGYSGASDPIYQLSMGIQIFKSNHFGRHPIGYMAIGYKHLSILIDNTFPPLIEFYPTLLHGKYGRSTTSEGEQLSSPSTSFLLHQRHKDRRGRGGS